MNPMVVEKPVRENPGIAPAIERTLAATRPAPASKENEVTRLPVAASLLPYGLSLMSLLRP